MVEGEMVGLLEVEVVMEIEVAAAFSAECDFVVAAEPYTHSSMTACLLSLSLPHRTQSLPS